MELAFTDEALREIAKETLKRRTGARGLRSVMEGVLSPLMYEVPSDYTVEKITITSETVLQGAPPEIERNPSRKPVSIEMTEEIGSSRKKSTKKV